jgi:hypothetical protein
MQLDFSLTLSEALYAQLIEDCQSCEVSPKQYAAEALESVIASRRLPKAKMGRNGAFTSGMRGAARHDVEPETAEEAGLVTHRILI